MRPSNSPWPTQRFWHRKRGPDGKISVQVLSGFQSSEQRDEVRSLPLALVRGTQILTVQTQVFLSLGWLQRVLANRYKGGAQRADKDSQYRLDTEFNRLPFRLSNSHGNF